MRFLGERVQRILCSYGVFFHVYIHHRNCFYFYLQNLGVGGLKGTDDTTDTGIEGIVL
jgi:hypothetical protein